MKKVFNSILGLLFTVSLFAQTDSLCFVHIQYQPNAGSVELVAQAYDFNNPQSDDFDYVWSTGETTMAIPLPGEGEYCVTVTSNTSGCTTSNCITIDAPSCQVFTWLNFDGTLTAFSSGFPPFTYQWDTGETESTINVQDGETYCVTVTDGFGCVADTCVLVEYNGIDSFCFADIFVYADTSGDIVLTAYGMDIIWPPGGGNSSYSWSTGDTTQSIVVSDLTQEYCVTVTTGICEATACVNIGDIGCDIYMACDPPGTFSAISSGVAPFAYLWNTGETTQTIDVIAGETYCVTVTDAVGCVTDTCVTADTTIIIIDTFCFAYITPIVQNSGIQLHAEIFEGGGSNALTYLWSTGETTAIIDALPGETYCVTVTTANGCQSEACIELEDFDCSDIYVLCDPDGTLGVISNGVPPFSYQWSTGDTTEFILGEVDSTYCVTITDAVNCTVDTCITLQGFPPIDTLGAIIMGEVYAADSNIINIVEGWVYLYQKDANTNMFNLHDSAWVRTDGFFGGYIFSQVDPGEYLTKAVVYNVTTGDAYVPTYHFNATVWDEADVIVVDNSPAMPFEVHFAPIMLNGTTSLDGPGSISGAVMDVSNLIGGGSRDNDGIANVTLILTSVNDETLSYVMSDENGEYSFNDLPYGTYRLYADYINHDGVFATITIGPGIENEVVNFEVGDQEVMLNSTEVDLSSEISIYPNPVFADVTIELSEDIEVSAASMYDANGRLVSTYNLAQGETNINLSALPHGLYLMQIQTNKGVLNKRILKLK